MSKGFRLSVSVLLVLTFALATGGTSAMAASENVYFLGARFIVGKGLLVTLKVSEDTDVTQSASLVVNGVEYALDCRVAETSGKFLTLRCVAGVSTDSVGGEATIWFGPDSFTTTLKDPRPWCYSVLDYTLEGPWHEIGTYCQLRAAGVGDAVALLLNPDFPVYWTYIYEESAADAIDCGPGQPELGNGYYYNCGLAQ